MRRAAATPICLGRARVEGRSPAVSSAKANKERKAGGCRITGGRSIGLPAALGGVTSRSLATKAASPKGGEDTDVAKDAILPTPAVSESPRITQARRQTGQKRYGRFCPGSLSAGADCLRRLKVSSSVCASL